MKTQSGIFGAWLVICGLVVVADLRGVSDVAGWKADLELFRTELPKRHPNPFTIVSRVMFNERLDALVSDLPTLDDNTATLRLGEIVVSLGDDHTNLAAAKTMARTPLPLRVVWAAEGLFITGIEERHKDALAGRITGIGELPVEEAVQRFSRVLSIHPVTVKKQLPRSFPILEFWEYARLTEPDGSLSLTYEKGDTRHTILLRPTTKLGLITGRQGQVFLAPRGEGPTFPNSKAFHALARLDGGKTLYAQYNRCWGRELEATRGKGPAAAKELPPLYPFFDEILACVRSGEVDRLIFDLRWNSGGASDPGEQFIGKLAEIESVNRRGKIFVLIGRQTFSSAILNAVDFRRRTAAVLVGEPTSGTASHFGEVRTFVLPHTEIRVNHSTKYFKRPGGDQPIAPDLVAEQTFQQYLDGIDPALDVIARYEHGS